MALKKGYRVLIWVLVVLVVLILAFTITIKLIFTKQKLLAMIQPKIEAALKRNVSIEDVSVSIFGGLGADVKGMSIYNPDGFKEKEFLKFDRFSVRVKFLPLLRKRIEIKKIILEKPELNIEKNSSGVLNIADLVGGKGKIALLPFAFERMEIIQGKVSYFDELNHNRIILNQINQNAKLKFDRKFENGEAEGKIEIKEVEIDFPKLKQKIPQLYFSLEHDLKINLPGDSLEIKKLRITLGKVSVDVLGKIEKITTQPYADLAVSSKEISISDLLSSIPQKEGSPLNKIKSSGIMKISASFSGEPKLEPLPEIKGKVILKDIKLQTEQFPIPFDMKYGEINFDPRSLSFYSAEATLKGAPVDIKVVIDDFKDPNLAAEFKTKVNLSILQDLRKLPEGTTASGEMGIDFKAYGKVKETEELKLSGDVSLKNISVTTPSLAVPIKDLNGDFKLQENNVKLTNLGFSLGKSSLSMQGEIRNVLPFILKKQKNPPIFEFTLNSPYLNLDEILPAPKEAKKTEKQNASSSGLFFLGMDMDGKIDLQKVIFRKIEFTNLMANLSVKEGVLKIDNVVSNVYSGSVGGKAVVGLAQPTQPQFFVDVNTSQIEANNFLSQFTLFKDHLFGKLNLSGNFSGKGSTVEDIRKSLTGSGSATITQGKLVNWDILNQLGEFLKMKELKNQEIKILKNSFKIESSRLYFEDFFATTTDADWEVKGSVGFDASLDYSITVYLSPSLSNRFDLLGELSDVFKDEKGRLILDLKVSGLDSSPKFTLDTSRAEKSLQQKLKIKDEKLKEELKKKGEDVLKKLFKK
jgi:uncharacterized protein involved in outer membrane biogenesis